MKRKFLVMLLALASALCICFGIAACGPADDEESSAEVWTIERVYARATDLGFSGSLDDLIAAFKGDPGKDGVGIKRIYINEKGALIIELTEGEPIDLGVIRGTNGKDGTDGTNGKDGVTPHIGENGHWFIGEQDTGIKAEGTDGEDGTNGTNGKDGVTPHIGENGHWFIGEQDTGIKAEGTDGKDGVDGKDGTNGTNGKDGVTPHIGENGHWFIGEQDTGIKAEGTDGKDGVDGKDGINGTNGKDGKSAYDIWKENGHSGTEEEFLEWLRGTSKEAECSLHFALNHDRESYTVVGIGMYEDVDLVIPAQYKGKAVTAIAAWAFQGLSWIESVEIPASVKTIGGGAFNGCRLLQSVTFEGDGKLTSIGVWVFMACDSLTSITIPEGVTSIGNEAFSGCGSLTSITIPASVTSIGYAAFYDCSSLNAVHITDLEAWCGIDFGGVDANPIDANPLYYAHHLYVDGREVTDLHIPDGVTEIKQYAFNGGAFTSITIPEGVTSIGNEAFSGCGSLTSITIPASVTSIGYAAFYDCSSLARIEVAPENANYSSQDGILYNKEKTEFVHIPKAITGAVTIPEGVTWIGNEAFSGCGSLTSITIPASVTSIGGWVFWNCDSLETIEVAQGNPVYHSDGNCLIETDSQTLIAGCNSSVIPSDGSVTSIGNGAFAGCSSLTSITIPEGVTSIEDRAFYGCSSLTSITIPASLTRIEWSAFEGCESIQKVYYGGTKEEWRSVSWDWDYFSRATVYFPDGTSAVGGIGDPNIKYSDWYIVGSGYGTLNSASWDYFLEDFRLEKTDEENKFIIHDVTLYEGDNFKLIKRNPGDEAFFGPDEDRADFWSSHLIAGSGELDNHAGTLKEGSLKNIEVAKGGDGVYDIWVIKESAVMFTVYYERTQPLDPLPVTAKYECYVVGDIASKSTCCWPDNLPEGSTLADCCIPMTLQEDGKTFRSEPIYLVTTDRIRVYNAKDKSYHPDGVNNDQKVTSDGLYTIAWDITGDTIELVKVD